MRYVCRELPPEVDRRLEGLAFLKDPGDLATRYREAVPWFHEATQHVDERQIRSDSTRSSTA